MDIVDLNLTKEEHRKIAATLFNYTWELLEDDRTPENDDLMISVSHASLFHWRFAGGPLQIARGHWIISRVYSTLKMAESAKYHALQCLNITIENNLGNFDLGFAYEAMARSFNVEGNKLDCKKYKTKAMKYAELVENKEDKNWLLKNLETIDCD